MKSWKTRKKFIYMEQKNFTNSTKATKTRLELAILDSPLKPAFIPFVVAGFPSLNATKNILKLFNKKNAAAIELGLPFSDPLADGASIQKASKAALEVGANLNNIFSTLEELKVEVPGFKTPIVLFTYFNPVLSYGVGDFIRKAHSLGVSGLIIPDLPLEESEEVQKLCGKNNINFIMLVSPTSGEERTKKIANASEGFIYLVSTTGVTGAREDLVDILKNKRIPEIIENIKKVTKIPVAVGFGVSKASHIRALKQIKADAAIVGSAVINIIDEFRYDEALVIEKLSEYIDELYS